MFFANISYNNYDINVKRNCPLMTVLITQWVTSQKNMPKGTTNETTSLHSRTSLWLSVRNDCKDLQDDLNQCYAHMALHWQYSSKDRYILHNLIYPIFSDAWLLGYLRIFSCICLNSAFRIFSDCLQNSYFSLYLIRHPWKSEMYEPVRVSIFKVVAI